MIVFALAVLLLRVLQPPTDPSLLESGKQDSVSQPAKDEKIHWQGDEVREIKIKSKMSTGSN